MIDDTLLEAEEKMDKAVTVAQEDFSNIRTGRVTPSVFSKITAEYYGTQTPLNQLASFHVPEPRMITIQPFDKGSVSAIEKAIRNSDLGVNPTSDGVLIRVVFPELTEERRREYVKTARSKAEDSRVSIRNIRRHAKDALDKMVKNGEAGEDEVRRAERELQDLTDTYIAQDRRAAQAQGIRAARDLRDAAHISERPVSITDTAADEPGPGGHPRAGQTGAARTAATAQGHQDRPEPARRDRRGRAARRPRPGHPVHGQGDVPHLHGRRPGDRPARARHRAQDQGHHRPADPGRARRRGDADRRLLGGRRRGRRRVRADRAGRSSSTACSAAPTATSGT